MAKSAAIILTPEEAMLVDYVTTLHSYDYGYLELLKTPLFVELRKKIAPVIAEDTEKIISFSDLEIEHLLLAIPISFRFHKDPCGYNLKVKLFKSQIPAEFSLGVEMPKEPAPQLKPEETENDTKSDDSQPPNDYSSQDDS